MSKLSHLDKDGKATMVDVSAKTDTEREAGAESTIFLSEEAYALVMSGDAPKGDVFAAGRIAGIMAAKKTSELIPLCHPLSLSHAGIEFVPLPDEYAIRIVATAKTTGPTGVEMEALTAASVAALTIYDMVKAVDRSARIDSVRVISKSGGKSGSFQANTKAPNSELGHAGDHTGAQTRAKARATPRVLVHEVAAPKRVANLNNEREALREFMITNRLRATQWAKSAEVPVSEVYAFLNGRARALAPETSEKLARAARSSVEMMLGRTQR
jgi:cyclic pyranopterin phosphate synthase